MKIFYVHDETGSGVGFNLEADAKYASTGVATQFTVNALALEFRTMARAKKGIVFPMSVLDLPDIEKKSEPAQ